LVDTTAPSVSSVAPPANGSYGTGQNLDFTVNYNENVTVTGIPTIGLAIGVTLRNASYVSGSGTTALVFRYTVQAGETDTNGIASASPIVLNSGTMQDAAGNNAPLTFTAPNTTGVLVDTTAPTISSVTGPANGSYRAGQNLDFPVTYSENVTVMASRRTALMVCSIARELRSASCSARSGHKAVDIHFN